MIYDEEELQQIFDSTAGRCYLCGKELSFDAYSEGWSIDHSLPKSEGGTDHGNNLYPACSSCKGNRQGRPASEVRAENGLSKPPLSRKQKKKAKKKNAYWYGGGASVLGLAFGGPLGALAAGGIGAYFGYQSNPAEDIETHSNTKNQERDPMHEITIFPLGNADSTRIDLNGGEKLLIDYADVHDPDDDSDMRIDLEKELREDLNEDNRNGYDVVAFTHLDNDHVCRASDFFHLQHAEKYQGNDRIEIEMLWVPAAAILEENLNGDPRVIRQEARYRLKEGSGIRIFSTPGSLDDWLEDQGIDPESRRDLFVDAGECVPDYNLDEDGLEVFAHTPHATRSDDGELLSRNNDALAFQATFLEGGQKTRMHFFSDLGYEMIEDIVRITKYYNNHSRLDWDLFHLSHHSSYKSLAEEKGDDQTEPVGRVENLFEEHGSQRARMISTSKPIPSEDTEQPPHRQAANYYKSVAEELNGEYVVTMQHPSEENPKPVELEIDSNGHTLVKKDESGEDSITSNPSPRAGG